MNIGFRTFCPLFSYYVIGVDSDRYKSRNSIFCFDDKSLFGTFFKDNAPVDERIDFSSKLTFGKVADSEPVHITILLV